MRKSFKYKLIPTMQQKELLSTTLDLHRHLYNSCLEQRIRAYKKGESLTKYGQMKELAPLRQELPEYKALHSHTLQDVVNRLDKAYQAFFRRVKSGDKAGFPRFQGANRYDSFTFKEYKATVAPDAKHVYLPKIGNVRIRLSRPIDGKIKTCTVKRQIDGWYVVFSCEVQTQPLPKTRLSVGIDRGIKAIIATSDGELFENPKHLDKSAKALRKAQRKLSRRKRGSKRREQARIQVAKIYLKIARQRADYLHKLANYLVQKYDVLVFEDLNVKGMSQSRLAKHILDAGWSQLRQFVDYKAEYAGKLTDTVKPHYSSQECSMCGHISKDNRPTQERFSCVACFHTENADTNASKVILGRSYLAGANSSRLLQAVA